jgi:hypothetical protein
MLRRLQRFELQPALEGRAGGRRHRFGLRRCGWDLRLTQKEDDRSANGDSRKQQGEYSWSTEPSSSGHGGDRSMNEARC